MALRAGKRPWKAKKEKFHTCRGPRRRPCLGQGQGRRISENFPELSSKIPKLIPKIIPKSVPESNFPKLRLKVIAKKCSARKLVNVSPKFVFFKQMFLKLTVIRKAIQSKNPTSLFRHARTRHSSHASRRRVVKMSFRRAWRRAKPVKLGQGGPPNESKKTIVLPSGYLT